MTEARVLTLHRYPVKSLQGETVPELLVDKRGAATDRAWALYTAEGRLGSGKTTRRFQRIPGLLDLRASLNDAGPEIHLPDGRRLERPGEEMDRALSEFLGLPVACQPETSVSHFDEGSLHLLSTAALRWLRTRLQNPSDAVAERFRANIVVDLPGEAPLEDAWVGRSLRIGDELEVRVTNRVTRCVMVTQRQGALPEAPDMLHAVRRDVGVCLGVYASVLKPGCVHPGDAVTFID